MNVFTPGWPPWDILVYGKDTKEHDERLLQVLEKFEVAGATGAVPVQKVPTKVFVHVLDKDGNWPDPEKTSAITQMKPPANVIELPEILLSDNCWARNPLGFGVQIKRNSLMKLNKSWQTQLWALYDPCAPTKVCITLTPSIKLSSSVSLSTDGRITSSMTLCWPHPTSHNFLDVNRGSV